MEALILHAVCQAFLIAVMTYILHRDWTQMSGLGRLWNSGVIIITLLVACYVALTTPWMKG